MVVGCASCRVGHVVRCKAAVLQREVDSFATPSKVRSCRPTLERGTGEGLQRSLPRRYESETPLESFGGRIGPQRFDLVGCLGDRCPNAVEFQCPVTRFADQHEAHHREDLTLHGDVHSWTEKEAADQAVWAAPGVSEVENKILVTP